MKLGIAQLSPEIGNIERNIKAHNDIICLAVENNVDAIFFPELSITGYEPKLADGLSIKSNDKRFEIFQQLSNDKKVTIGIGVPLRTRNGVGISMLIYSPNTNVLTYTKQILHEDEKPFFVKGNNQIVINHKGNIIAPAICYESLHIEHLENAIHHGANIYIACVAKSQEGINKAKIYFPNMAKEKGMTILMANCIGHCDDFESVGQSAVWDNKGNIIGELQDNVEGILVYNTETNKATIINYKDTPDSRDSIFVS